MINLFKRLKLMYATYNFFHRKQLVHNEAVYKRIGLSKKYYSPVSSKDFAGLPGNIAAQPVDMKRLEACQLFKKLSAEAKHSLESFDNNGYAILPGYLHGDVVDAINNKVSTLLDEKKIKFAYGGKIMFAIHDSPLLRSIGNDAELKELLSVLIGGNAILFQSINFINGSEQATHSDSIHMTTYPLGGLLGVWVALEDITEENGPLHYYPGSHKLPYYLNADYNNEGSTFLLGSKSYTDYEDMIAGKIVEKGLKKINFLAKKGDVLIWHANLFHGGNKHLDKQKTRKSMVFHYFKEGSICYHEITQRPALIRQL